MAKTRQLTNSQLRPFSQRHSEMIRNSCVTLCLPGTFLEELKNCGINERGVPRNQLIGCIVTPPSGSQLAIETVFFDNEDQQFDNDLHVVNLEDRKITSFHKGWGTWVEYYGNQHHANKSYLLGSNKLK